LVVVAFESMAYIVQNIRDTLAEAQAVAARASCALAASEVALDDIDEDR
jgi:hypothetical protein